MKTQEKQKEKKRPEIKRTPAEMAEAELRFLLLKENFDYITAFEDLGPDIETKEHMQRFGDFLKRWNIQIASDGGNVPLMQYEEIVSFYNPRTALDKTHPLYALLPTIMDPCPVQMLVTRKTIGQSLEPRDSFGYPEDVNLSALTPLPYERILKIDVRESKEDILRNVELILDRVKYYKTSKRPARDWVGEAPLVDEPSYIGWDFKNSRFRKEATEQLAVWNLRKKRIPFREIAKTQRLTEDLAKKRFYRAYELTQLKPYDPVRFAKTSKTIKKADLPKDCQNCPDRKTCTILCPEHLRYADQDHIKQREKNVSEESDSYRDFITQPGKTKLKMGKHWYESDAKPGEVTVIRVSPRK